MNAVFELEVNSCRKLVKDLVCLMSEDKLFHRTALLYSHQRVYCGKQFYQLFSLYKYTCIHLMIAHRVQLIKVHWLLLQKICHVYLLVAFIFSLTYRQSLWLFVNVSKTVKKYNTSQ